MSNIKSNSRITAADISALKTKIQAIYANRNFLSSAGLKTLNGGSPGFGDTSIAAGNYINNNFYYALNALLQLQDITGVIKNGQYDIIFQNGVSSDLLTTINNWETTDPKTTTRPISCRGGCVGFCYNVCSSTCAYKCYGSSDASIGSTGGNYQSGHACTQGGCIGTCHATCSTACFDQCNTGCTSCENCCKGDCYFGCNDICQGGCKGTCSGGCSSGCGSGCTGGCSNSCRGSCTGQAINSVT